MNNRSAEFIANDGLAYRIHVAVDFDASTSYGTISRRLGVGDDGFHQHQVVERVELAGVKWPSDCFLAYFGYKPHRGTEYARGAA